MTSEAEARDAYVRALIRRMAAIHLAPVPLPLDGESRDEYRTRVEAAPLPLHMVELDEVKARERSYRDAILAAERERTAALVEVAREVLAHTSELEDAWRSGAITEHDGRGGSRSNRNVDVDRKLRTALRAYEEGAK